MDVLKFATLVLIVDHLATEHTPRSLAAMLKELTRRPPSTAAGELAAVLEAGGKAAYAQGRRHGRQAAKQRAVGGATRRAAS
ncbi:MAG: hypothetical protein IT450_16815 [Phycisphaerales bacterium]|nr:hypothetical protein [Phycisphaerales bacterium]